MARDPNKRGLGEARNGTRAKGRAPSRRAGRADVAPFKVPEAQAAEASASAAAPDGFIAKLREDWQSTSALSKILAVAACIGAAVGVAAWLLPNPLKAVPDFVPPAIAKELDADQLRQVKDALTALSDQVPSDRSGLPGAEDALRRFALGDVTGAKAILERIRAEKEQDARVAVREKAAATRHLAAIEFIDNKAEALSLYREATTLDPTSMDGWIGLGDAAMLAGTRREAERAYQHLRALAEESRDPRDDAIAWMRIGDVRLAANSIEEAEHAYAAALAIAEEAGARELEKSDWRRNIAFCHDRIGDVLSISGRFRQAREAYARSQAIRMRHVERFEASEDWLRDLSISHDKLGDMMRAEDNPEGALASYKQGHEIATRLANNNPDDSERQRDLSVSFVKIGDTHLRLGQPQPAAEAFDAGLKIREALAIRDRGNGLWQQDLLVAYNYVAEARKALGDDTGWRIATEQAEKVRAQFRYLVAGRQIEQKIATPNLPTAETPGAATN